MTTIGEIATIAKVSIATVSLALNGSSSVKLETKQRILKIAEELNYTPNIFARSLRSNKTQSIGVLTEDITSFVTPKIIDAIEEYVESQKYHLILCNMRFIRQPNKNLRVDAEYLDLLKNSINILINTRVEGIIYVGSYSHIVKHLLSISNVPFVYAYCVSDNPNIPAFIYNDEKAAYDIATYLINKNHRNIGIIAGPKDNLSTNDRLIGFQKSLFETGILYNPNSIRYGDWSKESGYELALDLLKENYTAIFCMNDLMSGGVIDAANKLKISIPEQLSLVGFDNRECSHSYTPKLTTVDLPLYQIGLASAQQLLKEINGEKCESENNIFKLDCSIVERQSVADLLV